MLFRQFLEEKAVNSTSMLWRSIGFAASPNIRRRAASKPPARHKTLRPLGRMSKTMKTCLVSKEKGFREFCKRVCHSQQNYEMCTLWHEIITKIIPWELFFVIFEGFRALEMSIK